MQSIPATPHTKVLQNPLELSTMHMDESWVVSQNSSANSKQSFPQQRNRLQSQDFDTIQQDNHMCWTQTELNDFMVIEQKESFQDYKSIGHDDWKNISDKGFQGYKSIDIHVALLTQELDFIERRKLWCFLCRIGQLKQQSGQKMPFEKIKHFKTEYSKQIYLDTQRTKVDKFFDSVDNQESLIQILTAYAVYDEELGYTQGMNFIVAYILSCYDMSENDKLLAKDTEIIEKTRDEDCFYVFVHIMITQRWRYLFIDGLPGLIIMMEKLKIRLHRDIPDLYRHFESEGIDQLLSIFQQYYLTLLMYQIPSNFTRTILDMFLFEGEEFIHLMILAMLKQYKDKLMQKNFEGIIGFCRDDMLGEFYKLFTEERNKKSLTKTLERLGLIQIYDI